MSDAELDALRHRRDELQQVDDGVSYVRRVAQGRADVVRDTLNRKLGISDLTPLHTGRHDDLPGELSEILADRLLGDGGRPPRPVVDFSDHPLAVELDRLCAASGFGRLDELEPDDLERLAAAIEEFERKVSARRRELFAELDGVTEELVERLRAVHGSDE